MKLESLFLITFFGALSACTLTSTTPAQQGPKQALGTVTGMVIGGKIANDLTEDSSKNNKVNSQAVWKNPDSGNSGVIYPTKTYSLGDQPCREFTQEINIGGKIQTGYGKACRMADGSWQLQ